MGDMSREPSMEEILSSIRRVIARDESAQQASAQSIAPLADAVDDDDVLELTETEAAAPTADTQPVQESPDMPASAKPAALDTAAPELVSPLSAAASRSSLDVLAAVLASGKDSSEPAAIPHGEVSVNALVEAALRPMLKQWLDANLPAIVERLVAAEIARITGTRG